MFVLVILQQLLKNRGRILSDISVFDVYTGDNIGSDEKSIAYNLTFQMNDRTLTDEEVTKVFENIITEVENKIGAKLRINKRKSIIKMIIDFLNVIDFIDVSIATINMGLISS